MKLFDARKPLSVETEASDIRLSVRLLNISDRVDCACEDTHDNAIHVL